uniref:Glycosyltransferase family 69 protein n=1 Tax=Melanopsichium pennsylvanicum 4 TaxID=1398559 RepID=A0A077QQT5_9BASI|nr:conserved hypothetical protein [Melanopsichium pennsylvanicum 4]
MSLCPRAAVQALQSPPELSHEFKHDAAYFHQSDYPQYTFDASNRLATDQEPLLEPQPAHFQHHIAHSVTSTSSRFSRFLALLVSSSAVTDASTSASRIAWLPMLLVANLVITVAAFIAACVHFNTFTTLFLYLALLVVTFPLLSLSLLLIHSGSHNCKLQQPDWLSFSTPTSEQSFSSLVGLTNGLAAPASETNTTTNRSRYRSSRAALLERCARSVRYVQCVLAIIWCLAIVDWLFLQPMLTSSNGDDMAAFIHSAPSYNSATTPPMKVFIVSNLYNSEDILPTYTSSLVTLINHLGPSNVFVSIYESHSKDRTKAMLAQFDRDLGRMNVSRRVLSDDRATRKGKGISSIPDRVAFLANVRNIAMQPFIESGQNFTHVLWLNDVIFTPQDALNTLQTNNAQYDQACAMDFIGNGFYDTWVVRDVQGDTLKRQWPYFKRSQDIEAMQEERPFEVNSCWNGITAFDAKWFYPSPNKYLNTSSPAFQGDQGDEPLQLPIHFRTSPACLSSECQLVSYDIHRALHPTRPTILINPTVKLAYNKKHYWLFNSLVPSPILRVWRLLWRDWIAYRLGGWLSEGRRHGSRPQFAWS